MSRNGRRRANRKPPGNASPRTAQRPRQDDPNLHPEQELAVGLQREREHEVRKARDLADIKAVEEFVREHGPMSEDVDTYVEYTSEAGDTTRWHGHPGADATPWAWEGDDIDITADMARDLLNGELNVTDDARQALILASQGRGGMKIHRLTEEEKRHERRMALMKEKAPVVGEALGAVIAEQQGVKEGGALETIADSLVVRMKDGGDGKVALSEMVSRLKAGETATIDPDKAKELLRSGAMRDNPSLLGAIRKAAKGANISIKYIGQQPDGSVDVEVTEEPEAAPTWTQKAALPYTRTLQNYDPGSLQAAVSKAEMAAVREAVEADQDLMEKIRSKGATITWSEVPGREPRSRKMSPEVTKRLLDTQPLGPNLPRHLGRADGLPQIRRIMLAHLEWEEHRGAAWRPLPLAPEHAWRLYFATKDFVDLYEQMHQDFSDEHLDEYVKDILEAWGTSGQIIVGFDSEHYPTVLWSGVYNDSTPDVEVPADPWVKDISEEMQTAVVGAFSFQWLTPEDGATRIYAGWRTRGDTFRTSVWGSPSTREAILMAWMLANPALGFLESKPRAAGAGLPPRVKEKMSRKDRQAEVIVVSLRKRVRLQVDAVQHAERKHREYVHRFVVRGHWKQQAYGTGRTLRRRIYVMPYVKGPEGAPFLERERVYQW